VVNLTFVVGIERFNTAVWDDVERRLAAEHVVRIKRFPRRTSPGDRAGRGHRRQRRRVQSLINMRPRPTGSRPPRRYPRDAVFAYSLCEVMALTRVGDFRVKATKARHRRLSSC
jgi:hypothetical protein